VNAACEAITARGERPTVELVRSELKGGSPNALTPMVRTWKESRQPPADAQQVAVPAEPITLPAAIQRAIDGLSASFGAAVAEAAETERRRSRLEVEAAVTRARAEVEEARLAADDERSATEAVRNEVMEQEAALVTKDQEIARLTVMLAERDQALTELKTAAAVAPQKADGERLRAERAEAEAERLRQERTESEAVARDAIARATKAEGEVAGLRTELAAPKGRR
jgi:chromosome segregation ATPase